RPILRTEHHIAMLPQTLQRSIGPAESLLRQHAQSMRRFGPPDRGFFVPDPVTTLANLQREILIFGERVIAETAALFDQFSSPRADCARHHRDAVQARERAPIHVLRRDVLKRLPARYD